MSLLVLALAAEIGAAAPESLKPCANPRQFREVIAAPKDPQYERMTRIRRIKTDCGEIRPLSVLFTPKESPLDYTPAPGSPSFGEPALAFAPEAPAQEADDPWAVAGPYAGSYGGASAFGPLVGMDARPFVAIPAVPEPETLWILAVGLLALVWRRA